MKPADPVKRSERATAFATVVTLHVLALLTVLATRHGSIPIVPKAGGLSVVSLPAKPPPAPAQPSKPEFQLVPQQAASASLKSASAAASPGTACGTLELVMAALLEDPAAISAVRNAPPEARSIADAIVIWNAEWSPAAGTIEAPLGAARAAISRSLATVPDPCLDEDVAGPRLLPISVGDGTTFLVVGSGMWRWRGLLIDPLHDPNAEPLAPSWSGTG